MVLAPEARAKMAFSIWQGLWQFRYVPFGLCNVPATFERLMEKVLVDISRSRCVVYLNDLLMHGRVVDGTLANIHKVFTAIRKANLSLHSRKTFLGHVLSGEEITTDPAKVAVVKNWPTPTNVQLLRSFLWLTSYYCRFVKDFATVASPLNLHLPYHRTDPYARVKSTSALRRRMRAP